MTGQGEKVTEHPDDNTFTEAEVSAALDSVINSETLARADRARALLSYLVRTEQSGDASRLKGFTIAQDVFGKDDDFDPAMDAVVRVQAGRLREHLATFYADEGRNEPVRISVPKGTYVPVYVRRRTGPAEPGTKSDGGDTPVLRDVDFGATGTAFKLDEAAIDGPLPGTRKLAKPAAPTQRDPFLSPFIVRNVKRFWLALAMIIALLTVILFLVWGA